MDGLNYTHGRDKKCIQCFGGKLEGKYYLEDGRTILKWFLKGVMWDGMDWIHMALDRDKW
jgi:hypothetical protein